MDTDRNPTPKEGTMTIRHLEATDTSLDHYEVDCPRCGMVLRHTFEVSLQLDLAKHLDYHERTRR